MQTVERALELYGAPVYVRKEIVHNKHVVEELRELLDAPEKRAAMGSAGTARMSGPLSWKVSAERLIDAYSAAVASRS